MTSYDNVLDMLKDNQLEIADNELNTEIVDRICELVSGFMLKKENSEEFCKLINK